MCFIRWSFTIRRAIFFEYKGVPFAGLQFSAHGRRLVWKIGLVICQFPALDLIRAETENYFTKKLLGRLLHPILVDGIRVRSLARRSGFLFRFPFGIPARAFIVAMSSRNDRGGSEACARIRGRDKSMNNALSLGLMPVKSWSCRRRKGNHQTDGKHVDSDFCPDAHINTFGLGLIYSIISLSILSYSKNVPKINKPLRPILDRSKWLIDK